MLIRTSLLRRWLGAAATLALAGGLAPMALAQPNPGPPTTTATNLALYTFTTAIGDEPTFPADAQPANGTVSVMRRGSGVLPSVSANRFSSSGWTVDSVSIDTAHYYSFRISAAATYQLALDSLVFDERRSGTGPTAWQVRSSLDGFGAAVASGQLPDDTNIRTQSIGLPAAFAMATTVEFRLYGFAAEVPGGTWRLDNVRLVGTIAPGAAPAPTVQFSLTAASVMEMADTVRVGVTVVNPDTVTTTVQVQLAATGTATDSLDFRFSPATQTLTFAPGTTTQTVSVVVLADTLAEADETVVLTLLNPMGATLGAVRTFTLTILDDDSTSNPGTQHPALETIAAVTRNAADGVALRLNDTVRVRGIVASPNTRTAGYSVALQDATGGITLFKTTNLGTLMLAPGDSVEALGVIAQFNGLTELVPDSIYILGTGATLPTARVVTVLDEATESEVVKIIGPLTLPMPTQWTGAGSGFTVDATDGTTTYQLRILRGTDVYSAPAPTQPFSVTGIGGQFDNAAPYLEGYQLQPRFLTDIELVAPAPTVQFSLAAASVMEMADTVRVAVTVLNPDTIATTVQVQLATTGTATDSVDFRFSPATQTLTFAPGTTTQTVFVVVLADTLAEADETVVLTLLNPVGATLGAMATFTLTILDNDSIAGPGPLTPPLRTIAAVTVNDAQGVATSLAQAVRVRGIITSPNLRTSGYQSALQDRTGGIGLFLPATATLTPPVFGDSVELVGVVAQFRGLTQITIDSFRVLLPAQPIPSSRIVTVLDETTESEVVQIVGPLTLVTPAQWTGATAGFSVDATDGTTTYQLRISPGTNLVGAPAPTQPFRVWGIGSQFSAVMPPLLTGYQLLLRSTADIAQVTGLTTAARGAAVMLYPNPATDRLTISAPAATTASVTDALGRTVRTVALTTGEATLDVTALPAGVYSVRAGTAVKRFVKE